MEEVESLSTVACPEQQLIRRRVTLGRSRNGCVTCKQRRVRCHKEKPICSNCTRSKKVCLGYPTLSTITRDRTSTNFRRFVHSQSDNISEALRTTALEITDYSAFDYFRSRTIPLLVHHNTSNDLLRLLHSIPVSEPFVLHACLAMGSMHALLDSRELDQTQGDPRRLDTLDNTNVIQHYARCLKSLRTHLASARVEPQVLLLACLLLSTLASMRRSRDEMLLHLRTALTAMQDSAPSIEPDTIVLRDTIRGIGFAQVLHGQPRLETFPEVQLLYLQAKEHIPETFDTLNTAVVALRYISSQVLSYVHALDTSTIATHLDRACVQAKVKNDIIAWQKAFRDGLDTIFASAWERDTTGQIMRASSEMAMIHVMSYDSLAALAYDHYADQFNGILDRIEASLSPCPSTRPQAFSLGTYYIPLCSMTAVVCRHPRIRRRAVDLMALLPRCEAAFDAEVSIAEAKWIIIYEEHGNKVTHDASQNFGVPGESRVTTLG